MVGRMVDVIQFSKKYLLYSTLNIAFSHGDHTQKNIGKLKSTGTSN